MAKAKRNKMTETLTGWINDHGVDEVFYRLREAIVEARNVADQGTNVGEKVYWQRMVHLMSDFEEKVSEVHQIT